MADLDLDRFEPPPDSELVCPICHCVLNEPYETPCQHVFCKKCIHTWMSDRRYGKKCPTCRNYVLMERLKPALTILCNLINKLRVRCVNRATGCDKVIAKEFLENHEKDCEFASAKCIFSGCELDVLKREKNTHEEVCVWRIVRCTSDCNLDMPFKDLERHECVVELKKNLIDQLLEVAVLRNVIKKKHPAVSIPDSLRTRIREASQALNLQDALTLSHRVMEGQLSSWEKDMIETLTNTVTLHHRNQSLSPEYFSDHSAQTLAARGRHWYGDQDQSSHDGNDSPSYSLHPSDMNDESASPAYSLHPSEYMNDGSASPAYSLDPRDYMNDENDNYFPISDQSRNGSSSDDNDVDVETLSNEAMTQGSDSDEEEDNEAMSPPQSLSEDDDDDNNNNDSNGRNGGSDTSEEEDEDRHQSDSDRDRGWGGSDSSSSHDSPRDQDHYHNSTDEDRRSSSPNNDNPYNSDAEDNEDHSEESGSIAFSPPEYSDNEQQNSESDHPPDGSYHAASPGQASLHTISSDDDSHQSYRENSTHTVSSGEGSPVVISPWEESPHNSRENSAHSGDETEREETTDEHEEANNTSNSSSRASPVRGGDTTNDDASNHSIQDRRRSSNDPFTARREQKSDDDSEGEDSSSDRFHRHSHRSNAISLASSNDEDETSESEEDIISTSKQQKLSSTSFSSFPSRQRRSPASYPDSCDAASSPSHVYSGSSFEDDTDKEHSEEDEDDSKVKTSSAEENSDKEKSGDEDTGDNREHHEPHDIPSSDSEMSDDRSKTPPQLDRRHATASAPPAHQHQDVSERSGSNMADGNGGGGHNQEKNSSIGAASSSSQSNHSSSKIEELNRSETECEVDSNHKDTTQNNEATPQNDQPKIKEERCSEGSFEPDYTESESEERSVSKRPKKRKLRYVRHVKDRGGKSASQDEKKSSTSKMKLLRHSESFPKFRRIADRYENSGSSEPDSSEEDRENGGRGDPGSHGRRSVAVTRTQVKSSVSVRRHTHNLDWRPVVATNVKKDCYENSGSSEPDGSEEDRENDGSGDPGSHDRQSTAIDRRHLKSSVSVRRHTHNLDWRPVIATKVKKDFKESHKQSSSKEGRKRRPSSPAAEKDPKKRKLPVSLSMPTLNT